MARREWKELRWKIRLSCCLAQAPTPRMRLPGGLRTWKGGTKGLLSYGSNDYLVLRHGPRKWEVCCDEEMWWFGFQWSCWIGLVIGCEAQVTSW